VAQVGWGSPHQLVGWASAHAVFLARAVPFPDLSHVYRSSSLNVSQALLDDLTNVDFIDQVIPNRILWHPIHELMGVFFLFVPP